MLTNYSEHFSARHRFLVICVKYEADFLGVLVLSGSVKFTLYNPKNDLKELLELKKRNKCTLNIMFIIFY